jgi:hypothetical protein
MGLRDEIAADMQGIEADLDNPTGNYLGQDYACIPAGNSRMTTLEVAGFEGEVHFSVRIRRAVLGDVVPEVGKKFTYDGTEYRIVSVYKDAFGAFYLLHLQDRNR